MLSLILVSLIWAFSFGLIKGNLTGLDSNFVSFARLLISLLVFLPFMRLGGLTVKLAGRLMFIGALQYGLMYLSYIYAYQFLQAYEVALFTIFTPLYVSLLNDGFRRKFQGVHLMVALMAVIGSGVIVFQNLGRSDFWLGFSILQLSNICFAFGQVYYRETMAAHQQLHDRQIFALLYFGAVTVTALASLSTTNWPSLTLSNTQVGTLLYLGILASGICFFLWNYGARQVNGGTLAVMNNLKVPLGVAASMLFFGESTDPFRLLIGGGIVLAALVYNEHRWTSQTSASG